MSRAAKYPTCSTSGKKWKIFAAQNEEIFHNRVKSGFFVFVNVKDTDFMRYSKNGTQHVFCLKYLVTVILMGQNVDKWVKYFNGCCMWTNETLLSVSGCNEPHVAGGSAEGAGGGGIFISIYVVFVLENLVIIAALCRVTWSGNYTIIEPSAACHNQHAPHAGTRAASSTAMSGILVVLQTNNR